MTDTNIKQPRIMQPSYKRIFSSLKNPRSFGWKTVRFYKHWCREISAPTIVPIISKELKGCVAMFHVGRSGSTVLGDLLDQHPDIFWDSEIY